MEWEQLTPRQKAQVMGMFDQTLSDPPNKYTYEIGTSGDVLSRKHK